MSLTPYQRICRAAERNRGLRLSAAEVSTLATDHAISMRAGLDDDAARGTSEQDALGLCDLCGWHKYCTCKETGR